MELEVVAGTYDCMIRGLSIDILAPDEHGLRPKFREHDHTGSVRAIASGGHYLASGGTDEAIKLYNMKKHAEIGTLMQHEGSITWLAFHEDTHLLSASEDHTLCIWRCGSWEHVHTLTGHKAAVTCVSIHPSGKLVLSVSKDKTLRTWNLLTGHVAFIQKLPQAAVLVAWSPIGDQYTLAFEKSIATYDVESGAQISTAEIGKRINCILYVQDTVVAVGSEYSFIQLVSSSSGECLAKLEGHTNRVKGLSLSPGGELLFSVSSDGSIRAWRLAEPLKASQCISTVETGSRLTCVTVVCPESLLQELKSENKEEGSTQDLGKPSKKAHKTKKRKQELSVSIDLEPGGTSGETHEKDGAMEDEESVPSVKKKKVAGRGSKHHRSLAGRGPEKQISRKQVHRKKTRKHKAKPKV